LAEHPWLLDGVTVGALVGWYCSRKIVMIGGSLKVQVFYEMVVQIYGLLGTQHISDAHMVIAE
jgi:hypothetical protein